MEGLCGNMDGDFKNDGFKEVEARMGDPKVKEGDNLFLMDYKDYSYREGLLEAASEQTKKGKCSKELRAKAEKKCAEISVESLKKDCIFDICATRDLEGE